MPSERVNNGGVKVTISRVLPCSIDVAWEALHTPEVFRAVSSPFTVFRTDPDSPLPARFRPSVDYRVRVQAFGLVPLGSQTIHLVDEERSWANRTVTDIGHGDSGPLAAMKNWRHSMELRARPDGHTDFRDQLSVDAGALTALAWLGFRLFWWWRGVRLTRIARHLDAPITKTWNERYLAKPAMWSGKVNPSLEATVQKLPPGRALDVGCGEGADALFLAERGFATLGVEASSVAVFRAHTEAIRRGPEGILPVSWLVADIAAPWGWREGEYDLVNLQFIHTDLAARTRIWDQAIRAVAPGGTLIIAGHDPADALQGIPRPPAEMCFSESDLRKSIPDSWAKVEVQTISRQQVVNGAPVEVADIVLVARR